MGPVQTVTLAGVLRIALLWLPATNVLADASQGDTLRQEFVAPPPSAEPRVWWHWMNGNISKEGIRLDLDWMHRIGIGGLQIFDASIDSPKVVDQRLLFMTPRWSEAFQYAVTLSGQLGLEVGIAGSPGFSESGGPWVSPQDGMKKLVWTETRITGGSPMSVKLPQPPTTVGPFQNMPVDRSNGSFAGPPPATPIPDLYRDVAVIACRLHSEDKSMIELKPLVTSSSGAIDGRVLWGEDFNQVVHLPSGKPGRPAWIQLDLGHQQVVQSISVGLQAFWNPFAPREIDAVLESSVDGSKFNRFATAYDTADSPPGVPPNQETITFQPVKARYIRLVLPESAIAHLPEGADIWGSAPAEHRVTKLVLYPSPRVNQFEKKAGYFLDSGLDDHATRHLNASEVLSLDEVVDLTSSMRPDGTLNWTPPAGRWAVLRFGYSLLGTTNSAAAPEATGLEADKLSGNAIRTYVENYLGRYAGILKPQQIGARGLRVMVNDSYEAGPQNWTSDLPAEFAKRRGYDIHPWLPALTGRVIQSAEMSDRFLWDFRRTLGELLTENHYSQISSLLHRRGMIHYSESHEAGRAFIGDGMDAKRDADVPMSAMWMPGFFVSQEQGDSDIRESASVAHIYGQNLVAAESMTAFGTPRNAYAYSPESLKSTVDRELSDGVNLFVIHTSVHQPIVDHAPGITLGPFGQWFTRNETWAEQATPWIKYLSRSSYLLQKGHFVADIIYYYGQDSNITALYAKRLPDIPKGYAFDFANAHALNQLSVRNGYLVTASGMQYRVLALDPRTRIMSLDVLRRLSELVKSGATVVGEKPQNTPSAADNLTELRKLADTVWGPNGVGLHRYGKGQVFGQTTVSEAIKELHYEPDFTYSSAHPDTSISFVHRKLDDGDLYFLNNRNGWAEKIVARFRATGRQPEIWRADRGDFELVTYRQDGPLTAVSLNLDPHDAEFVVFRKHTPLREQQVANSVTEVLTTVKGPWRVHFQDNRGAPEQISLRKLSSWSDNLDPGIKYFSGMASYDFDLTVAQSWLSTDALIELDLGTVRNVAEVLVNGNTVGIAWKTPYKVNITDFIKPGTNHITARVTNLWVNRLIGDKQPHSVPIAVTTFNPYKVDSALLESGLLGPIRILRVKSAAH